MSAKEHLQKAMEAVQKMAQEKAQLISTREKLVTQLSENTMVKKELELVKDEDIVYKQTGPALVVQELAEAKGNVQKRLDYIEAEVKRYEKQIEDKDEEIAKMQAQAKNLQHKVEEEMKQQQQQQQPTSEATSFTQINGKVFSKIKTKKEKRPNSWNNFVIRRHSNHYDYEWGGERRWRNKSSL
eukprot:m.158473 g.158473  ORF g.158473 m.158473 type:complete len:184 (-) comp13353_c1_seq1:1919-2470(-)